MAGNVWEWTSSLWKSYPYDAEDGREDPDAGGYRVLRGGSWDNSRNLARCAYRVDARPDNNWSGYGFRVVVAPTLPS
jgi:formylglycine-generating enzyme required for sulfatase activity